MKKFVAPWMEIQRLVSEDVLTGSECTIESLGCTTCYCALVTCPSGYTCSSNTCPRNTCSTNTDW